MQVSGIDMFKKAKTVRLKSHHEKYLTADKDQESVAQDRSASSDSSLWTVEIVQGGVGDFIRLKSCYNKYLTALDEEFLLGATGRKVVQSLPRRLDSSVEWEPIRDGMQVRLKTRYGNYLRANGGLPPWRNSVTHDIPHRHHDWVLWEVNVMEVLSEDEILPLDSTQDELGLASSFRISLSSAESSFSLEDSVKKSQGRLVYYHVMDDDDGNVDDEDNQGPCFQFKGHGLEELIQKLEEETGIEDAIVCTRNPVNGKLCPLHLALPPNNATMHVVVVPRTSKVANDFVQGAPSNP